MGGRLHSARLPGRSPKQTRSHGRRSGGAVQDESSIRAGHTSLGKRIELESRWEQNVGGNSRVGLWGVAGTYAADHDDVSYSSRQNIHQAIPQLPEPSTPEVNVATIPPRRSLRDVSPPRRCDTSASSSLTSLANWRAAQPVAAAHTVHSSNYRWRHDTFYADEKAALRPASLSQSPHDGFESAWASAHPRPGEAVAVQNQRAATVPISGAGANLGRIDRGGILDIEALIERATERATRAAINAIVSQPGVGATMAGTQRPGLAWLGWDPTSPRERDGQGASALSHYHRDESERQLSGKM